VFAVGDPSPIGRSVGKWETTFNTWSTTMNTSNNMTEVYRAAEAYRKAGLSLLPIRADGSKMPACRSLPKVWDEREGTYRHPWKPYTLRQPTADEVRFWFDDPRDRNVYGLAVIGGAVSGGLEIIDCDNAAVARRWCEAVTKAAPGLLDRLVRVQSPRPGLHAYYRCAEFGGNMKLARAPDPDSDFNKPKTLIEVKGEGGYCLAPPSPGRCHPTGRPYEFVGGTDLTAVPTITPGERAVLLDAARGQNCWEEPERPRYAPRARAAGAGVRPGEDFDLRADWDEVLAPHGWQWAGRTGETDYWSRPGKGTGTSATTNHDGTDRLYVFSTDAPPFEEGRYYTKFAAYTLLEHAGDFAAAARALAQDGYGRRGPRLRSSPPTPSPVAPVARSLRSARNPAG
jgi:hypothetical protein